jgi:hypothetical protein
MKTPSDVAAAEARPAPMVMTTKPSRGVPRSASELWEIERAWVSTRANAAHKTSATDAEAAMISTQRQPRVTAIPGTARPASRPAAGIAVCLMPKASPRRWEPTTLDTPRFAAGCASALPTPPRTSAAYISGSEGARPTPSKETVASIPATTIPQVVPRFCTTTPDGRERMPVTA